MTWPYIFKHYILKANRVFLNGNDRWSCEFLFRRYTIYYQSRGLEKINQARNDIGSGVRAKCRTREKTVFPRRSINFLGTLSNVAVYLAPNSHPSTEKDLLAVLKNPVVYILHIARNWCLRRREVEPRLTHTRLVVPRTVISSKVTERCFYRNLLLWAAKTLLRTKGEARSTHSLFHFLGEHWIIFFFRPGHPRSLSREASDRLQRRHLVMSLKSNWNRSWSALIR